MRINEERRDVPPPAHNRPIIRYSFANSKQLHIDVYKQAISDLTYSSGGNYNCDDLSKRALDIADAAVDTLFDKGYIFKEKQGD